MEKTEHFLFH